MQPKTFCQSCSMPIDDVTLRGTEKDGTKSAEYCKYCYVDGAFVNPGMSIDDMRDIVKTQMQKINAPENIIRLSLESLPHLKRWRNKSILG